MILPTGLFASPLDAVGVNVALAGPVIDQLGERIAEVLGKSSVMSAVTCVESVNVVIEARPGPDKLLMIWFSLASVNVAPDAVKTTPSPVVAPGVIDAVGISEIGAVGGGLNLILLSVKTPSLLTSL